MKHIFKMVLRLYFVTQPMRHMLYTTIGIAPHSCRHKPTCRQYAQDVLEKYDTISGCARITKRLLTCHPFAKET